MDKGAFIKEARRVLGLSQGELAEALNMGADGARSVRRWEADPADAQHREPSGPVLVAIRFMLATGETDPSNV